MSATISRADEYREAAERAKALEGCAAEGPEAAELAAAMRKWEEAQQALDERTEDASGSDA